MSLRSNEVHLPGDVARTKGGDALEVAAVCRSTPVVQPRDCCSDQVDILRQASEGVPGVPVRSMFSRHSLMQRGPPISPDDMRGLMGEQPHEDPIRTGTRRAACQLTSESVWVQLDHISSRPTEPVA